MLRSEILGLSGRTSLPSQIIDAANCNNVMVVNGWKNIESQSGKQSMFVPAFYFERMTLLLISTFNGFEY